MRELTQTELATVSGGISSVMVFDPQRLRQLHAQVQREMQKVVSDLQRSVQPGS